MIMPNALSDLFSGQNRAPNTIQLRNLYSKYAIDAQTQGKDMLPFEQWAAQYYPNQKILTQYSQQGGSNNPY